MASTSSMPPTAVVQTFTLPDGRTLEYALYGFGDAADAADARDKPTVFHFHGYPGSHHEGRIFAAAVLKRGARLVAPTRPGMGRSTFQPGRRLLDWPADVAALADHLGVARFGVLGVSGGGPHALACWHALPHGRVAGCALVCSMFPASLGTNGMLFGARALLFLGAWVPGLLGVGFDLSVGRAARDPDPRRLADVVHKGMTEGGRPEVDRRVFEQDECGVQDALVESLRDAARPGGRGCAWEARVMGDDWGFGLADVDVVRQGGRIVMWHGAQDINVPVAMARKAAAAMEGVDLRVSDEDAHVSLPVHKVDEVVDTLVAMFGNS